MNLDILLISDIVGMIGVGLTLLPYFMLQLGKLSPEGYWYSSMNLFGSLFVIFSLLYHWNFPSFIIESVWSAISLLGIIRITYKKKYP